MDMFIDGRARVLEIRQSRIRQNITTIIQQVGHIEKKKNIPEKQKQAKINVLYLQLERHQAAHTRLDLELSRST